MCTLLNALHGSRARAQRRSQRRYADDYLNGFDVDAFSVVGFDEKRTVLMHSVCAKLPFSVRWLIRNRNANIHVKNRENKKMTCSFPCRPMPRNGKLHKMSTIRV